MMEPDKDANILGVITDHDTMINQPPDILLTNYKMLDYLLVRPKDASLWQDNTNPETLKFIVVDEFHTFDGAQGTDLACLLCRLKARLNILPGYLCCVGTSATMGDKNSDEQIRNYAADVFGEPFDSEAVITEDRLSPEEFFDGLERNYLSMPTAEQVEELNHFVDADDEYDYMQLAAAAWLPGVKSGRNTPRFICKLDGRGKKPYYFDSIGDYKYTAWIENCVEETEFTRADLSKDVSEIILTEALKLDMVREMPAKDNILKIFGLNKEHVFVSDHVITVKCDDCGSEAECSEEFSDMMQGGICSRRNCGGIMQQTEDSELGYSSHSIRVR